MKGRKGQGWSDGGRGAGFTLLEICMAVAIGLMMLSLAMPSLRGVFGEQRLRERMGEFEAVVLKASVLANRSNREVRLRWMKLERDRMGLWMGTMEGSEEVEGGDNGVVLEMDRDEKLQVRRLAARKEVPAPPEWSFWPRGLREPVELSYAGPLGEWVLRFGALVPEPEVVSIRPR
jgi:hypothetical protein